MLDRSCTGLGDIGQDLLSRYISIEPVVIELVRGLVTQGLMWEHRLAGAVPGQENLLQPAQISGEVLHLLDLLLVGAEASLNAPVAPRVVGPFEVVGQLEFCDRNSKLLQELTSPSPTVWLRPGGGLGHYLPQELPACRLSGKMGLR